MRVPSSSVGDPDEMQRLADKIVNEDLSVRAADGCEREPKSARAKPAAGKRQDTSTTWPRFGDRLDTRVKISLGARKGPISIDFATVQDLRRILTDLGEELDGV